MPGIMLQLPPEQIAVLDAYIAAQPDPKQSRPEAIRALVREGLAAKDFAGINTPVALDQRIDALEAKGRQHSQAVIGGKTAGWCNPRLPCPEVSR